MDGLVHAAYGRGLAIGNGLEAVALGVGHLLDGLSRTYGGEDGLLLDGLGGENDPLLLPLGHGDRRLSLSVGLEDYRPAVPFGLHLLVHGVHDVTWRVDPLDLYPYHPHPPLVGGVI